jgi:hypothetical protein
MPAPLSLDLKASNNVERLEWWGMRIYLIKVVIRANWFIPPGTTAQMVVRWVNLVIP